MKKIEEVIIPDRGFDKLDKIFKDQALGGVSRSRIEGRGKSKTKKVSVGRGIMRYVPEFVPRPKIEVVIKDDQVQGLINKILIEFDGPALDGKIFLVDVPIAIDLKTKEKGESAISLVLHHHVLFFSTLKATRTYAWYSTTLSLLTITLSLMTSAVLISLTVWAVSSMAF